MSKHDPVQNFIGGQFTDPRSGQWLENVDPTTGHSRGQVADSGAEDVQAAVTAAAAAAPQWARTSAEERCRILTALADGIDQRCRELAQVECEDGGKPIRRALEIEIPRAAANFRFYASSMMHFSSQLHENPGQGAVNLTLRRPLGVVACISPWNLPLYLFTWKVAPALAAGNAVIGKPSELTPRTAALLGEIAQQVGVPPGVLNILQGAGGTAGQALLEHPQVRAISFTGGTQTGRHVARVAAPLLKKVSLELGGKNPNLVFADCDYERALATSVQAAFANQGQICLCGSRILIERSLYPRFVDDLVQRAGQLKVGDPQDPETQIGAVISAAHYEKIESYLQRARAGEGGARILCGGGRAAVPGLDQGCFLQPTVIAVDTNRCALNQEEIFGPVVTVMPFDTEEQAIELANDVPYGLSATVWTRDLPRTMRLADRLQAGVIWVNTWLNRDLQTPFGGLKDSGVGREGGLESLRFFTEPKNVCIQYSASGG